MDRLTGLDGILLSPVDLIMPDTFIQILLVYPNEVCPSINSFQKGINLLQLHVPLLNGFINKEEKKIDFQRNEEAKNIKFKYISMNEKEILELECFSDTSFYQKFILSSSGLCTIGVFSYQNGGYVIFFSIHHYIADLYAACLIIKTFADIMYHNQPTVSLEYDRTPLFPSLSNDNNNYLDHRVNFSPKSYISFNPLSDPSPSSLFIHNDEELDSIILYFSISDLSLLKSEFESYSSYDALSAFIWYNIYTGSSIPPKKLIMAINARSKFSPPLSDVLIASPNFYALAVIDDKDDFNIKIASSLIRKAINEISNSYLRKTIDWLSSQLNSKRIILPNYDFFNDYAITDWRGAPFKNIIFGNNSPATWMSATPNIWRGLTILMNDNNGGVRAYCGGTKSQIKYLQNAYSSWMQSQVGV